jgi:hypothetical protein
VEEWGIKIMKYGYELSCDEFLNEFEKCITLQNKLYDRPCDRKDLNSAKRKISTFFWQRP